LNAKGLKTTLIGKDKKSNALNLTGYPVMVCPLQFIPQYFRMGTQCAQEVDQRIGLHRALRTLHAQDVIAILQIEVCIVSSEFTVNLPDYIPGLGSVFHIGLKNFYHNRKD